MGNRQFNYGGQAVIEGVMMRGSRHVAVAVRNPEGEIVLREEPIASSLYNGFWSKVPFVRGLGLLWDSLGLGMRALMFSAEVAGAELDAQNTPQGDIPEGSAMEPAQTSAGESGGISTTAAWGVGLVSFAIGIAIFFLLPAAAADGLKRLLDLNSSIIVNLIEGFIRLVLIIGYIWGIGRMDDVKRLWQYHGAEHKTINAYEDGADLTPESVARYPLEHPRCGTGFLLVVVVISVLVFSLLGRPPLLIMLASRIVLIPVIAGIAYEYIKLLARHSDNPVGRALVAPQLWMQHLTTREPTPDMLEVAITSLERVLTAEELPLPALVEPSAVEAR